MRLEQRGFSIINNTSLNTNEYFMTDIGYFINNSSRIIIAKKHSLQKMKKKWISRKIEIQDLIDDSIHNIKQPYITHN